MKILLSFLQDKGGAPHQIPAYRFWNYYIKNGIEEADMTWTEISGLDWAEGLIYSENSPEMNRWKQKTWNDTLVHIKKNVHEIDIFLTYLYPKNICIDTINEIKKLGIPCVNFYCDNVREFNEVPDEFKVFDLIWLPEYEALEMYRKAKIKYVNLPMPMWVSPQYRNLPMSEDGGKIGFIGSKDMLREKLLSDGIRYGLPIQIWGRGWIEEDRIPVQYSNKTLKSVIYNQANFIRKHGLKSYINKHRQSILGFKFDPISTNNLHGSPNFEEYIHITQTSTIMLGINQVPTFKRLHTNALKYSRLRDIEAPMLGACYLTEYCEGLDSLYDINSEIYTYSNAEELFYKATELLNNKAKRLELRANGQKRALQDHSIKVSLKKIKKIIFNG